MIIDANKLSTNFNEKINYIVEETLKKCQSFKRVEKINNIVGERIEPKSYDIKIITNGKMGSVFQDYKFFETRRLESGLVTSESYVLGKIKEYEIYVDPYMRWDDDRIIIKKKDKELYNIVIKNGMELL